MFDGVWWPRMIHGQPVVVPSTRNAFRARAAPDTMRRWVWVLAGGLCCSVAWVLSCVNDGNSGIPAGTDGGPCLQNGTCDNGLVCGLINGNGVCQPPGSDASSDGPSNGDAGTDSSQPDSGAVDADATCNPQPAFDFVNPCDSGAVCYDERDADFACVVCPGPYTEFFSPPCTRSVGTAKTSVCCVQSATLVDAGGCVLTLDITGSAGTLAEPRAAPEARSCAAPTRTAPTRSTPGSSRWAFALRSSCAACRRSTAASQASASKAHASVPPQ